MRPFVQGADAGARSQPLGWCLRCSSGRRDDKADKQTCGVQALKTSLLGDIKSTLAEAAECASSSILAGDSAIWNVQAVFFQ